MPHRIRFLPEARTEVDEAADWYESQRPGWRAVFAKRMRETLDRIVATPELHAKVYKDSRQTRLKQFPYMVVYEEKVAEVIVVAVFHTSRDPAVWQSRI